MLNWDNTGVTVELGEIVASGVDIWAFEYPTPAPVVEYNGKTATVPFDKSAFEQKIIDHYRFRQIGQETVGRWLHYFRTRIREIMPYYCQLYEFEAKWRNVDDPLESYTLKEEYSREAGNTGKTTGKNSGTNTGTNTGTASGSNTGKTDTTKTEVTNDFHKINGTTIDEFDQSNERRFSDTPQGEITNLDNYMSEAEVKTEESKRNLSDTKTDTHELETTDTTGTESSETFTSESSEAFTSESSDNSETNTEGSENEQYTMTRRGNIGVQPLGTEVKDIRSAFINIDMMVINELKDLFIQVY